jgi:serine/threonine protein kinase
VDRLSSERLEETTRLGSYEIMRKLARGGMAELFLARGPEGLVVLKKILPRHADNPRLMQLFLDEARLAGSLDHPNIVRTFGAGQHGGTTFFAMEYLHGQDVRTILHRAWTYGEQMPVEHAVHIASHVAAALHYAHDRCGSDGKLLEIVHRDVSPSNIFVSYAGAVKLVDFGVAKAATSSVKTRAGALKGKISYMSPEQAKGSAIDRRSDIFSLGIVLWEMITTQRLFRGENDLQTLQLIINQPPRPPSELQPACTPELDRIVLRALAQAPAARYQTAAELLRDLEEAARAQELASSGEAARSGTTSEREARAEGLAGYVAHLFSPEVRSWEDAKAAGVTLAQHLTSGGELTIPLTESDFIEAVDLNAMIEEEEEEEEGDSELDQTELQMGSEPAVVASGWVGSPSAPVRPPVPGPRPPTPVPMPPGVASAPAVPMRGARTATPPVPMPIVPAAAAPLAAASDEPAATSSGPWSIARGSSAVTPSAELPAVPTASPGGGLAAVPAPPASGAPALDPEVADRLLRRGLWVAAAIVAIVVVFSIVMAAVAPGG